MSNLSAEPMPVAIGFHPYFQLTDSPRDEWTIASARGRTGCSRRHKLPTGETEPIERLLPDPPRAALRELRSRRRFSDLVRDAQGRATMTREPASAAAWT